jgi:hypothetical protein
MQQDLLPAKAAVDWAMAQLPVLEHRIAAWVEERPYSVTREFDSKRGKDALRVKIHQSLPLIVNAEVGAIVNSIRSSLDLLAVALAERNGHTGPKDVYFPICDDRAGFLDTRRGGMKKIARLSDADKSIIENLQPYKGGHDALYTLHRMDIARKHRSLVELVPDLGSMNMSGIALGAEFPKPWPVFKHESTLVWIAADAPDYELNITIEVTLRQTPTLILKPVVGSLHEFTSLANSIIKLF